MPFEIVVEARGVYGRELFYLITPAATKLAQLLRCKAFTREQLTLAVEIGLEITLEFSNGMKITANAKF